MKWLGVDIGIINLALVLVDVNIEKNSLQVICIDKIDITCINHKKVPISECKLYHNNTAYDQLQHVFQDYSSWFEEAEQIFIERQPIGGLVHIEQLIFGQYRDKSTLVHPTSMHKWMNIHTLSYDQRKEKTMQMAEPFMMGTSIWDSNERKHDMADALCILLYQLHLMHEEFKKQSSKKKSLILNFRAIHEEKNIDDFFSQFINPETITVKSSEFLNR